MTMMVAVTPRSMIQHPNAGPWPVEITGPIMRPCPLRVSSPGSMVSSTAKVEDIARFQNCSRPHLTTLSDYIQSDDTASVDYYSNGHEDRASCPADQGTKPSYTSGHGKAGIPHSKWNEAQRWLISQSSGGVLDVKASETQSRDYTNGGMYYSSCKKDLLPGKQCGHRTHDWEKDASPHPWKSSGTSGGAWTKKMTSLSPKANDDKNNASKFEFTSVPSPLPEDRLLDRYSATNVSANDVKEANMKYGRNCGEMFAVPASRTRKPISDSFISPVSSVHSVSMRDTGTEMTPIASQEPSRTGTPIRATTPTLQSPVSSCPPSPRHSCSRVPLKGETRSNARRIKMSILPWRRTEEANVDVSTSLKNVGMQDGRTNVLELRAAAWANAEQSKYMARFKREEAKILARENREKAKAEAEIWRAEAKADKLRSRAHEKLMNKVAIARQKAEERRAAAEARRCQHASKTAHLAEQIRHTGRLPSSFSFFGFAFCH